MCIRMSLRNRVRLVWMLLMFSVLPGVVQGQQAMRDTMSASMAKEMETVVVTATRTPKMLKDVPVLTRVIGEEEIERADATDIVGLLETEMPGLEFTYPMSQQTTLNMQGFSGSSVLFLVDGERLAGETFDNTDYSRLILSDVGRVEIVKGAASSLYGSNAAGGVVNLISKSIDEPLSLNMNAKYGAYDEQRYGGGIGFVVGKIRSQTGIQYYYKDGVDLERDGKYDEIYGIRTWNFKERLEYDVTPKLKLTGRAGFFFKERESSAQSKDRYRDFSGGLKAIYVFNDENDLEVSYAFDQYDKSDYIVSSGKDIRDYSNVQHNVRALFNHTLADGVVLTLGGDMMRDYLMSYQFDGASHEQYSWDFFGQYDWAVTERASVVMGVRYDYYSEAELSRVSPKLSVLYKCPSGLTLRGSYSAGFRAPTLKEMYMNYDVQGMFTIYGNESLDPETSHNFSLSAAYNAAEYGLGVTGFYNLVDNRISTQWDDELDGQLYTNIDKVDIAGVEASVSAKYDWGLGARVSYVYTYEHMNQTLPFVAATRPHTATVSADYGRSWKGLDFNIALSGRIMGKVTGYDDEDEEYLFTSSSDPAERTYSAYSIWKLMLTAKAKRGITFHATVDNLFNYVPSFYHYNSPLTVGTTFSAGIVIDIGRVFDKESK